MYSYRVSIWDANLIPKGVEFNIPHAMISMTVYFSYHQKIYHKKVIADVCVTCNEPIWECENTWDCNCQGETGYIEAKSLFSRWRYVSV